MTEGKTDFHTGIDRGCILEQNARNDGNADASPAAQPHKQTCPQCGSAILYRDGMRYLSNGESIQRWLCRICGHRFSEKTSHLKLDPGEKPLRNNSRWPLNSPHNAVSRRRECISQTGGMELLAEVETRNQEKAAGATKPDTATVKGLLIQYAVWLQNQNCKSVYQRVGTIRRLVGLGANLYEPETVKETLAKQTSWKDSYKMLITYAYESLKMLRLSWTRPKYKQQQSIPFIPTEEEIDKLVAGCGKKVGTFLQGLKDTGCDPGELAKLRWIDINKDAGTVNITPVKGHNPRILRVTEEFLRRVDTLPRKSELVFNMPALATAYYQDQRKTMAAKLNNPRLMSISLTTFRHWKATTEYHTTKDIIHVQQMLGHKNIMSTMVYVNLEAANFTSKNDKFYAAVANDAEEACKLVEAGDYVTGDYDDGGKIFRKRK